MRYSNKELFEIERKAKKDKKKLTHITDKSDLSTEGKMKLGLCKHFVQFMLKNDLRLKDLARMTKLEKTRLSEITNYKINNFSVDKLVENLELLAKHDAGIREYLILLADTTAMPTPTVSNSRKLARGVREVSLNP